MVVLQLLVENPIGYVFDVHFSIFRFYWTHRSPRIVFHVSMTRLNRSRKGVELLGSELDEI